jgi:hypothetical protein
MVVFFCVQLQQDAPGQEFYIVFEGTVTVLRKCVQDGGMEVQQEVYTGHTLVHLVNTIMVHAHMHELRVHELTLLIDMP